MQLLQLSEYKMTDLAQKTLYDAANLKYQDAANLVGSAMGSMDYLQWHCFLILTFYTAKNTINRKYIHMFSLILGGLGFHLYVLCY
jgi:maltose/moltooligosaccharide transporter